MNTMTRRITTAFTAAALCAAAAWAADSSSRVRFHNEAADTTRLNELISAAARIDSHSRRIEWLGHRFIGAPYVAGTLNCDGTEERITVNLDEFDCTTLVETVLAINAAAADRRLSWRDFLYALENMRYRSGTMAGYASRLHYITDWALDNSHRGNLREITSSMPKAVYTEKNLDFMSTHANAYPQLADSAQLAGIKATERNFRHIRIYYIKSADVDTPEVQNALQSGDIVALSTKIKGLDVTHMGIIVKEPGKPAGLLHASSKHGKVTVNPLSLADYLRRSRSVTGIRIFRP